MIADAASIAVMIEGVGSRSARWAHIKRDDLFAKEEERTGRKRMPRNVVQRNNRFRHAISSISASSSNSSNTPVQILVQAAEKRTMIVTSLTVKKHKRMILPLQKMKLKKGSPRMLVTLATKNNAALKISTILPGISMTIMPNHFLIQNFRLTLLARILRKVLTVWRIRNVSVHHPVMILLLQLRSLLVMDLTSAARLIPTTGA